MAIILDAEEPTMRKKLESHKDMDANVLSSRISNYKHNTLPVCGHFDDNNKLAIVSTRRVRCCTY